MLWRDCGIGGGIGVRCILRTPRQGAETDVDREGRRNLNALNPTIRAQYKNMLPLGIATVAGSTLMTQVLLTRLFSATLYYHYAFAVISLAMLGLTAGGMVVYAAVERLPWRDATVENLSLFSSLGALLLATAVMIQVSCAALSFITPLNIIFNFLLFLPSLICSGIVVTLILTRHSQQVGRLYAWDLCGAGTACVVSIFLLDWVGPINGLFFNASLSALAGCAFARYVTNRRLRNFANRTLLALSLLFFGNVSLSLLHQPHITVQYAKGRIAQAFEYEAWNSYSRVTVSNGGNPAVRTIAIDLGASTPLNRFDAAALPYQFKEGLFNLAYHVRPISSMAVVGVGGGRNILSAIANGVPQIVGIELNRAIFNLLTRDYADFSGRLGERPGVRLINAEARSYLTQHPGQYDLIQISMIDTWAATAAGAFTLSENTLYTREGWEVFFHSLSPRGMVSFTRWYRPETMVGELYRLTSLAHALLTAQNISTPRRHLLAAYDRAHVTLIVSKSPLSAQEVTNFNQAAIKQHFTIVLSPAQAIPELAEIVDTGKILHPDAHASLLDISAPTDDRPFFFQLLSPMGALKALEGSELQEGGQQFNLRSVTTLLAILASVTGLSAALIIFPAYRYDRSALKAGREMLYFLSIGFGFMFIEIAQMQRMMIFLGHPTYALAVVLSVLLVASGVGSLSTRSLTAGQGAWRLWLVAGIVLALGIVMPSLLACFRGDADWIRVIVAVFLLAPLGFGMGMAFPIGMQSLAARGMDRLMPWLWGINGAASVVGSVMAVIVSIFVGISASYEVGICCYALAAAIRSLPARRIV